jgi:hypothetical protein
LVSNLTNFDGGAEEKQQKKKKKKYEEINLYARNRLSK